MVEWQASTHGDDVRCQGRNCSAALTARLQAIDAAVVDLLHRDHAFEPDYISIFCEQTTTQARPHFHLTFSLRLCGSYHNEPLSPSLGQGRSSAASSIIVRQAHSNLAPRRRLWPVRSLLSPTIAAYHAHTVARGDRHVSNRRQVQGWRSPRNRQPR